MLRLSIIFILSVAALCSATLQTTTTQEEEPTFQSTALPPASNVQQPTAALTSNRRYFLHIPHYSKPEVPVPQIDYPPPIATPSFPKYPQPAPVKPTYHHSSVEHAGYEIPVTAAIKYPEEIPYKKPIPHPIISSFSCIDRHYGYYADVENDCIVFHVCNPTYTATGYREVQRFSFRCGPGTVFSQRTLTCVHPSHAEPCNTAPDFYSVNEEFGKIPQKYPHSYPVYTNIPHKIAKPAINSYPEVQITETAHDQQDEEGNSGYY